MVKTHWRKFDYRIASVQYIFEGIEYSISQLKQRCKENPVYAEMYGEELEPMYGMVFISLQNYINSSIFDLFNTLNNKEIRYRQDKVIDKSTKTRIELIIGLANYFKHRDDDRDLRSGTSNILRELDINYNDDSEDYYSPIYLGLEILTENDRLSDLISIIKEWRANLWEVEEKNFI